MSEQIGDDSSEFRLIEFNLEELAEKATKKLRLAVDIIMTEEKYKRLISVSKNDAGDLVGTLKGMLLVEDEKNSAMKIESSESGDTVVTIRNYTSSKSDGVIKYEHNDTIYVLTDEKVTVFDIASLSAVDDRALNNALTEFRIADAPEINKLTKLLQCFEPSYHPVLRRF